jgi:hypothetical protein
MAGRNENDDLAFVHALALQRAGKKDAAVAAYRHFLEKYSTSPLAQGAQYRLALTLHDQKRDGDALLELAALADNHLPLRSVPIVQPLPSDQPTPATSDTEPSDHSVTYLDFDYSGATDHAIDQTMDALLNFAPVKSLATALAGTDPARASLRNDLRQVLQERCLAQEDYAGAALYADSDVLKKQFKELAAATGRLRVASGPQAAKDDWKVADYWATQAKLLVTSPLDSNEARDYVFDDGLIAGLQRRTNGQALDFSDPDSALESRNQWQHAAAWWNRTADADHAGSLAPAALWNVIDAQQKIVETSPYTQRRAEETNQAAKVRETYDRLESQYADSEEAREKAVYWTFPSADDLKKLGGYGGMWEMAFLGIQPIDLVRDGGEDWRSALGQSRDYGDPTRSAWESVCNEVAKLPAASQGMDAVTFSAAVDSLLSTARPLAVSMRRTFLINCLEDLKLLAQVPGLDLATREAYAKYRVAHAAAVDDADAYNSDLEIQQPFKDSLDDLKKLPGAASIADFIDFLALADTANQSVPFSENDQDKDGQPVTYDTRDYAKLASETAAFLKQYPKSSKREAAALLHLRALVLIARPTLIKHEVDWPVSNSWAGSSDPLAFTEGPFDANAFDAALQSYQAEFPVSQYANSILSLRADAALIRDKWGEALDCLVALHDPVTKPEFQDQVAIELSELFNELQDTQNHHAVLTEILSRSAARDLLAAYLKTGGVPYLRDFLTDQMAKAQTH